MCRDLIFFNFRVGISDHFSMSCNARIACYRNLRAGMIYMESFNKERRWSYSTVFWMGNDGGSRRWKLGIAHSHDFIKEYGGYFIARRFQFFQGVLVLKKITTCFDFVTCFRPTFRCLVNKTILSLHPLWRRLLLLRDVPVALGTTLTKREEIYGFYGI